ESLRLEKTCGGREEFLAVVHQETTDRHAVTVAEPDSGRNAASTTPNAAASNPANSADARNDARGAVGHDLRAMSNVAVLQELPAFKRRAGTRRRRARSQSAPQIVVELATSSDIESGMEGALPLLRRVTGAVRVEWWAPSQGSDQLALRFSDGAGMG